MPGNPSPHIDRYLLAKGTSRIFFVIGIVWYIFSPDNQLPPSRGFLTISSAFGGFWLFKTALWQQSYWWRRTLRGALLLAATLGAMYSIASSQSRLEDGLLLAAIVPIASAIYEKSARKADLKEPAALEATPPPVIVNEQQTVEVVVGR